MRHLFALALLVSFAGCTRYTGATALHPGADGSTWVYVQTSKDRRTGVYHCQQPPADGQPARCTRVVLD